LLQPQKAPKLAAAIDWVSNASHRAWFGQQHSSAAQASHGADAALYALYLLALFLPLQQRLLGHRHYVQGVAWDPLGAWLVSASADRSVRVHGLKPPPSGENGLLSYVQHWPYSGD
jgi:WD40 repeat protein